MLNIPMISTTNINSIIVKPVVDVFGWFRSNVLNKFRGFILVFYLDSLKIFLIFCGIYTRTIPQSHYAVPLVQLLLDNMEIFYTLEELSNCLLCN